MRLTLTLSNCEVMRQRTRRTGEVDELTLAVRLPYPAVGVRWTPAQVERIEFTAVRDTREVFGFLGPWEVRSFDRSDPGHVTFFLHANLPSDRMVSMPALEFGARLADDRPTIDRLVLEELIDEAQGLYPRPFGISLPATVGGYGCPLQVSVDTRRDVVRFTVAGQEVQTTLTALLGTVLDPDVPRSVSLPASPRATGRRRRRAVVGRPQE